MSNVTPTSVPSIDSTLPWHSQREFRWQSSSTGYEHYGMWDIGSVRFLSGGGIKVSTTTDTWEDDGTGNPTAPVENSDGTVSLFHSNGVEQYKFTKPTSASWLPLSSGGGTSTEGVPIVQWSASFSKNPGNDYWRWTVSGLNTSSTDYIYLYDEMPTATSTHQPIGTRTFSASSSSSTQYGLFIPDITKTYYVINFLSGGSFEVLATKKFVSRKVFCNFW